jgi:hypothetical protein
MLAFKLQTPVNPEQSVRHSEHGDSSESQIRYIFMHTNCTNKYVFFMFPHIFNQVKPFVGVILTWVFQEKSQAVIQVPGC